MVVSVDDRENPQFAQVHMMDAADLQARFDRAYDARKSAGHTIPIGRGLWISLYEQEGESPASLVGAGAGLESEVLAKIPLAEEAPPEPIAPSAGEPRDEEAPLSIREAKRRLALTFGVDPAAIRISVEG